MRAEKKGKRDWLYISEEDESRLSKLVESTGLARAFLLSTLTAAAIRAVEGNNSILPLPLRFEIQQSNPALNEPQPPYKTKSRK